MNENDDKLNFQDMLRMIMQQIKWKTTLKESSLMIYRPVEKKHFERLSETACCLEVRTHFPYATPATVQSLVKALLQDSARILDDVLFIESRKRTVGFLNGVFDLKNGCLREYSASDFILEPLPYLVPHTMKPEVDDWFLSVLRSWVGEDCVEWFYDLLAYLLFIHPNDEQVWINFFGMGANGKSVCLELLEKILGEKKVIGCDLQHINRFSGDTFQDKWLVIGRDSSSMVSDKAVSFIKSYSGDTKFLVEEKGGSSYDVVNQGKLVVSTNTLIQSKDRTFSWYRRLFPVLFPNVFEHNDKFKAGLFRQIPNIIRLLLHRAYLYRANHIPLTKYVPLSVQRLIQETRYINDRVSAFWELYFMEDVEDDGIRKQEVNMEKVRSLNGLSMTQVYQIYAEWFEVEFAESQVEPSLRIFGGPYGAFLQSEAGKYFTYHKTNAGRVIELREGGEHVGN